MKEQKLHECLPQIDTDGAIIIIIWGLKSTEQPHYPVPKSINDVFTNDTTNSPHNLAQILMMSAHTAGITPCNFNYFCNSNETAKELSKSDALFSRTAEILWIL